GPHRQRLKPPSPAASSSEPVHYPETGCPVKGARNGRSGAEPTDRRTERQRSLGRHCVKPLDHASVNAHDVPARSLGLTEGRNDLMGPFDLFDLGREDLIADRNLPRMHAGLAVHTEIPPMLAFGSQSGIVIDLTIDPVDNVEILAARGG